MKKYVSAFIFYKINRIICGPRLLKYGITVKGLSNEIPPEQIDQVFAAVETDSELHVVSFDSSRIGYNRYIEDASYYCLSRGESDPDIEMSPDYDERNAVTEEQFSEMQARIDRYMSEYGADEEIAKIRQRRFGT